MKTLSLLCIFALLVSIDTSAQLKDRRDKISYSIGANLGKNFKRQEVDVNLEAFFQGLKDGYTAGKLLMDDKEIQDTLAAFQKENVAKQTDKQKKLADENLKKGETFLAENKIKDSVVTLDDGLQYKILKVGLGKIPTLEDSVTVNYRGTLLDGTEFDNSYKRGEPATFVLSGVIKGWQEALQKMKVGSKWQIFIPPALGYGEKGYGSVIPPNAVLIFEVELLDLMQP